MALTRDLKVGERVWLDGVFYVVDHFYKGRQEIPVCVAVNDSNNKTMFIQKFADGMRNLNANHEEYGP